MRTVYAKHGDKCYKLTVSAQWCRKNDNGALVSCGLTVGFDLKESQLKTFLARGQAVEVTPQEYNHAGCQSSCTLRGDVVCRW